MTGICLLLRVFILFQMTIVSVKNVDGLDCVRSSDSKVEVTINDDAYYLSWSQFARIFKNGFSKEFSGGFTKPTDPSQKSL